MAESHVTHSYRVFNAPRSGEETKHEEKHFTGRNVKVKLAGEDDEVEVFLPRDKVGFRAYPNTIRRMAIIEAERIFLRPEARAAEPAPSPELGAPEAPVLSGSVSAEGADLSWTEPASEVSIIDYIVYRDGNPIAATPANQREYRDVDVEVGTLYAYTVTATGANGLESAHSNVVELTI